MPHYEVIGFKKILCTYSSDAESIDDAVVEAMQAPEEEWDESDQAEEDIEIVDVQDEEGSQISASDLKKILKEHENDL